MGSAPGFTGQGIIQYEMAVSVGDGAVQCLLAIRLYSSPPAVLQPYHRYNNANNLGKNENRFTILKRMLLGYCTRVLEYSAGSVCSTDAPASYNPLK